MDIEVYTSRHDLKDVSSPDNDDIAYLVEGVPSIQGRFGMFVWCDGDFTDQIAADEAEGIYIKADHKDADEGAWVRVIDGPMWTHWFGIVADSIIREDQNTIGLKSMMALAALGDTSIKHGEGLIWLNEPIDLVTSHALTVHTDFFGSGGFVWSCPNGGMQVQYTDAKKPPKFSDLTFLTAVANGGKGLRVLAPNTAVGAVTGYGAIFDNLRIGPYLEGGHFWTTQIELENLWYAKLENYRGKGKDDAYEPFEAQFGIRAINCQALTMTDWKVFHTEVAYKGDGDIHGEGINFSGGECVGCSYGICHEPAVFKPCISVHDMHLNCYKRAMVFRNVGQMKLHDIHVYKTHPSSSYWEGIQLINCHGMHIHHIYGSTAGCVQPGQANLMSLDACKDIDIDHVGGGTWNGVCALVIIRSNNDNIRISQLMLMELAPQLIPYAIVGTNNTRITIN